MENKVRWAEYNDTTFLKKRCGVCIRKGCFTCYHRDSINDNPLNMTSPRSIINDFDYNEEFVKYKKYNSEVQLNDKKIGLDDMCRKCISKKCFSCEHRSKKYTKSQSNQNIQSSVISVVAKNSNNTKVGKFVKNEKLSAIRSKKQTLPTITQTPEMFEKANSEIKNNSNIIQNNYNTVVQNSLIQKKIINDKIYVKTEEISEKKSKCNIS